MIVESLEPQGHGALQFAFEQLKKKLTAEGLFDSQRKRALPPLPERIGIVTSPGGAVIRDILHILERRCPGRHIRLFPAQVQGDGAAAQIASGIEYFSSSGWAEVVIIARGGGSLEDLWAFNEERVARAIVACSVPVVSAVGHETDFTIADFAADLRAPTPSAAAELIIATRESLLDRLDAIEYKLRQCARLALAVAARHLHKVAIDEARLRHALGRRQQRLDELESRLREHLRNALGRRQRALNVASSRLARLDVRLRLAGSRRRLELLSATLRHSILTRLGGARARIAPLAVQLEQLSPLKILDRGYAIVESEGRLVKAPEDAPADAALDIRLARGRLKARVTRS